ncbi:hypothetical protein [Desulfomicrobium salsuginis]
MEFFELVLVHAYTHGRPVGTMVGAGAFRPSVQADIRHGRHALTPLEIFSQIFIWLCLGVGAPGRPVKAGADTELSATLEEETVLADFGKKLILGLIAAACVVGVHAAMIASVAG